MGFEYRFINVVAVWIGKKRRFEIFENSMRKNGLRWSRVLQIMALGSPSTCKTKTKKTTNFSTLNKITNWNGISRSSKVLGNVSKMFKEKCENYNFWDIFRNFAPIQNLEESWFTFTTHKTLLIIRCFWSCTSDRCYVRIITDRVASTAEPQSHEWDEMNERVVYAWMHQCRIHYYYYNRLE